MRLTLRTERLGAHGLAIHANADLRLGIFEYVITSPAQHRLHHSRKLEEAGNYGPYLPLWDMLFGTFTWRPGRQPAEVGTDDETSFPSVHRVLANTLHPFIGKR